jgi:alginate O-acetyltransferase complex protein AlgI
VVLGWVMFRADTVGDAMTLYAAMFRLDGAGLSDAYAAGITRLQVATLALAFVVIAVRGWQSRRPNKLGQIYFPSGTVAASPAVQKIDLTYFLWVLPLFALSVLKLSAQSYSPFLYFQF